MTKKTLNIREAFGLLKDEFRRAGWLDLDGSAVNENEYTITLPDSYDRRALMLSKVTSFMMYYGRDGWDARLTPGKCELRLFKTD